MKKSLVLVLTLVMVCVFATGCFGGTDVVEETPTMTPATAEATVEATQEAVPTVEAAATAETDDSTVTEEATAETIPDETDNAGDAN